MKFMDKDLNDIVVTLPLQDGTNLECGVYASFEVRDKTYFALLPMKEDKTLDFEQSYMLYRVEMDDEENPIILYIENDYEYTLAASYFGNHFLDHPSNNN